MQSGEFRVCDGLSDNFGWWSRYKLDDTRGETGFGENLVNDVVRVCRSWGRFPNDNIPNKCRCTGEIPANRSKVERGNGEHESFQWSVFNAAIQNGTS